MAKAARGRKPKSGVELLGVGAILYTPDGRYLMQLRDDRPEVSMSNQWGLFGGVVEKHERPERALARELIEELSFSPKAKPLRFSQISWNLGFAGQGTHAKIFYALQITEKSVRRMLLGEGREMRLFSLAKLLATDNVIPWDAFGITLFARRAVIRKRIRRYRR